MLLLKLDISKAFDTISWPFLLELLRARGFGQRLCRWIEALLSTATSRIQLNGHQGPPITHRRGVRQGDSLCPMLFIIAMDVQHRLVAKASADGVLRLMEPDGVKYQCSLYADDVILFIRPTPQEATAIREILTIFGNATGLNTNLAKCSITPIYGGEDAMGDIVQILQCQVKDFPVRYLGLPLSIRRVPKAELQTMVDNVMRKMPACHGALMARSGRLVWIKSVLRAIPIYMMMVDSLPPWVRKEINTICRKFLWVGKGDDVRGKCMVSWGSCCRPTNLGGLGITDLKLASIALQSRWLWLQRTDTTRAWSELPIKTDEEVMAFFQASTFSVVGDGRATRFWTDRWMNGTSPADISPNLTQLVSSRTRARQTVRQGLTDRLWARSFSGGMTNTALAEFLDLWEATQGISLTEQAGRTVWRCRAGRQMATTQPSPPTPRCTRAPLPSADTPSSGKHGRRFVSRSSYG